jgi:hypothetical protein
LGFTTEARRARRSKDSADDALLEEGDVEVDQQAHLAAAKPEIGEELGFVDGLDPLHRL